MSFKSSKAVFRYVPSAQNYGGQQNGITSNYVGGKGKQYNSYERTAKATCVDKHTGAFAHSSMRKVTSSGGIFKERSTGRIAIKNEYTNTKVRRVADKNGYFEHRVEEKFRRVDYVGGSSIKNSTSSNGKNTIKDSSSSRHSSNFRGGSRIKVSTNVKGVNYYWKSLKKFLS